MNLNILKNSWTLALSSHQIVLTYKVSKNKFLLNDTVAQFIQVRRAWRKHWGPVSHCDFLWPVSAVPPVRSGKNPVLVLPQTTQLTWQGPKQQVKPYLRERLRFQWPQVVFIAFSGFWLPLPLLFLVFFPSAACALSGSIWIDFGSQRLQWSVVQSPTLWTTKIWRD